MPLSQTTTKKIILCGMPFPTLDAGYSIFQLQVLIDSLDCLHLLGQSGNFGFGFGFTTLIKTTMLKLMLVL